MTEQRDHREARRKAERPAHETLPDESPTAGEAARGKGDVEWGPRGGKGGHETHGRGERAKPQG